MIIRIIYRLHKREGLFIHVRKSIFLYVVVPTDCYFLIADIDMGALMTVCTLSITLLMVYGAIKGKATHLLPFFCLQMFDFAITTYVVLVNFHNFCSNWIIHLNPT